MAELEANTAGADDATQTATAEPAAEEKAEKVVYQLGGIAELPGSRKRLTFTVAWDDFAKQSGVFYKDLQQNANIDGFRKGKAPTALVRARYGKDVKKQTAAFIIENCAQQIVEENSMHVYRRLDDHTPEIKELQPLEFATTVEVKPEFDPAGYDAFEVEVTTRTISDQTVADQLEQIRRQNGSLVEKDADAVIEEKDAVTLSTKVFDDHGQAIDHLCWNERQVPSLQHLPEPVVAALLGKSKGATVEAVVETKHGDHSHKQKWEIVVKEIKRLDLPALDDDFAQDVGAFENLDKLKERIRKDLEDSLSQDERRQAIEQINDKLIERNSFELPDYLVDIIQYQMITEDAQRMRKMGVTLADLGQSENDYRDRTRDNSAKLARINLLLAAIGKKEKVEVTDADVDAEINKMAERAGRKPLAIRANLEAQNRWDSFREDLRLDKISDFLIARAKMNKVEKKVDSE